MKVDFQRFEGSLPYASELFGVYQPLLGWRSRRAKNRFHGAVGSFRRELIAHVSAKVYPVARPRIRDQRFVGFEAIEVGSTSLGQRSGVSDQIDSATARRILDRINAEGLERGDPDIWERLVSRDALRQTLDEVRQELETNPSMIVPMEAQGAGRVMTRGAGESAAFSVQAIAERESVVAGTLAELYEQKLWSVLDELFFGPVFEIDLDDFHAMKAFVDPLETFDPTSDIDLVTLSPIGIVHLFRQYFFEFETFLGTPVQHIWLSPGSSVELIEIHTRKTVTERYVEHATETVVKSEKSVTEEDELSDAVRTENQNSTKFGVGGSVDAGVNLEVFTAHANVTTNYGYDTNEKKAREQLHKQTRQQSTKLTTEIRENFKSTFKTTEEVVDTTSKRYVLQNASLELVNYELRRKMRQVGVQLQDIGTQLCWQTYVDDPGRALGIARLVHVAEPADLANLKQPKAPTKLEPQTVEVAIAFPYENTSGSDEMDVPFYHGSDEESWPDHNDTIVWQREYQAEPPDHGYTLDKNIEVTAQHSSICVAIPEWLSADGKYKIRLDQVNFDDQPAVNLKVKLHWSPPDQAEAQKAFEDEKEKYDREAERAFKDAFIQAAKERIEQAANVEPRPFAELREEERIVVYRRLIASLLDVGISLDNPRTRHVAAELVNTMFDVEKMLYFVAPEWWRPRLHQSHQTFGKVTADGQATTTTTLGKENLVSWGGTNEYRPDNYYITEKSKVAKLGSSLGWLLQLDGDNLRNAFLNAPWVKAVIPIRPGRELAALNWLTHASVEGADGLDAKYQPASTAEANEIAAKLKAYDWTAAADVARYDAAYGPGSITIRDALKYLAIVVAERFATSNEVVTETVGGDVSSYLPTDKVFEHGFYPLQGGFKAIGPEPFEVFDQWVEVLPTDQIVAVEVEYDPKTGRQV